MDDRNYQMLNACEPQSRHRMMYMTFFVHPPFSQTQLSIQQDFEDMATALNGGELVMMKGRKGTRLMMLKPKSKPKKQYHNGY